MQCFDVNSMIVRRTDESPLVCPKCAVLNPECDEWRVKCSSAVAAAQTASARERTHERGDSEGGAKILLLPLNGKMKKGKEKVKGIVRQGTA